MAKTKTKGPYMTDEALIQASGWNRNKNEKGAQVDLKSDEKRRLRVIDEQDAIHRYKWYNIPCNLTSEDIERMLYYRGQLMFFYFPEDDRFYFMPYALDGTIDFYGRFNTVHPIPFSGGTTQEDKERIKNLQAILSTIKRDVAYDVILPDELTYNDFVGKCVILKDYTPQLSQTIIPRQELNDTLLDMMADVLCFARTNLLTGTGVRGMKVNDNDQAGFVIEAGNQMIDYARQGKAYIPISTQLNFEELGNQGHMSSVDDYLLTLQSLDNMRLSGMGLRNGGIFEKKAHLLESENAINQGNVDRVSQDGISLRQHFCNIVNSIWGFGMWCEISETALEQDTNMDGVQYDIDHNEKQEADASSAIINQGGVSDEQ